MKKIVGVMFMTLGLMSMSAHANMAVMTATNTAIINTVAASSVIDEPEAEQASEPVVEAVKVEAKEKTYNVEPAGSYMLTICNSSQVQTALAWQTVCTADKNRSFRSNMCPVMSFLRFCQPATAQEVKGLNPVKANYNNIFLKD